MHSCHTLADAHFDKLSMTEALPILVNLHPVDLSKTDNEYWVWEKFYLHSLEIIRKLGVFAKQNGVNEFLVSKCPSKTIS
jgi:hypothetical protein